MDLKPGKFYSIILKCEGYFSQARAKDVKIIELSEKEKGRYSYDDINPTHSLIFYDCSCGVRKEIPGIIEKENENEIIFAVSTQKKFLIKNLER